MRVTNWAEGASALGWDLGLRVDTLVRATEASSNSVVAEVSELSSQIATVASAIREQAAALHQVAMQLDELIGLVQNPRATEAAELRRSGAHAARNGWLAEAEQDLRRSTEISRFDPAAQFLLGTVLASTESWEEAAAVYGSCARYASGVGSDDLLVAPGLAASAALLAMRCEQRAGVLDPLSTVRETLRAFEKGRDAKVCPALLFEVGCIDGDRAALLEAVDADPALVVEALARGIDRTDIWDESLQRWRQRHQILAKACDDSRSLATGLGLPDLRSTIPEAASDSGSALVATAAACSLDRHQLKAAQEACRTMAHDHQGWASDPPAPLRSRAPELAGVFAVVPAALSAALLVVCGKYLGRGESPGGLDLLSLLGLGLGLAGLGKYGWRFVDEFLTTARTNRNMRRSHQRELKEWRTRQAAHDRAGTAAGLDRTLATALLMAAPAPALAPVFETRLADLTSLRAIG